VSRRSQHLGLPNRHSLTSAGSAAWVEQTCLNSGSYCERPGKPTVVTHGRREILATSAIE
jgi:hypothetical protein